MTGAEFIEGFSRLKQDQKTALMAELVGNEKEMFLEAILSHRHPDDALQKGYNEFSENTLSNYFLPYSVAPNFLINNKVYHVPMVVEESSVVAAASAAAKFWMIRGGFQCSVLGTAKTGQVHFTFAGNPAHILRSFNDNRQFLLGSIKPLIASMEARGGGVRHLELEYHPTVLENYYYINLQLDTVDAMGANFINSCLELIATAWQDILAKEGFWHEGKGQVIMSILSNYTPDCLVRCRVSADVDSLDCESTGMPGRKFAEKLVQAVAIAKGNVYRAVTHNKGILNGIDAVVIATGNDFRAVESNAHAYAARDGQYRSLSEAWIEKNVFIMELEVPLAIGTVGGLTQLHPLAAYSLKILGRPDVQELMRIVASVGLANHFSALRSLVTSGIQKGHMKLHLTNLLERFRATEQEKISTKAYFEDKTVSYHALEEFLNSLRK